MSNSHWCIAGMMLLWWWIYDVIAMSNSHWWFFPHMAMLLTHFWPICSCGARPAAPPRPRWSRDSPPEAQRNAASRPPDPRWSTACGRPGRTPWGPVTHQLNWSKNWVYLGMATKSIKMVMTWWLLMTWGWFMISYDWVNTTLPSAKIGDTW